MAEQDLPNLGLLIKLLKLTTSTSDMEALAAMRKANEQLVKFGGDWERLLRGKVTVISDPFVGVAPPSAREVNRDTRSPSVPQPPRPTPPPQTRYTTPHYVRTPQPQSTVRMARARPKRGSLESLA